MDSRGENLDTMPYFGGSEGDSQTERRESLADPTEQMAEVIEADPSLVKATELGRAIGRHVSNMREEASQNNSGRWS